MKNLEQNNLANATTDLGFVKVVNENASELGTSEIALQREVVLEDGNTVKVEGITPSKMKAVLNEQTNNAITYQTPGENFEKTFEEGTIRGIVQEYNSIEPPVVANPFETIKLFYNGTQAGTKDYSYFEKHPSVIEDKDYEIDGKNITAKCYLASIPQMSSTPMENTSIVVEGIATGSNSEILLIVKDEELSTNNCTLENGVLTVDAYTTSGNEMQTKYIFEVVIKDELGRYIAIKTSSIYMP